MCGPDHFKAMMSPWHIGEKFACVGTITTITHKPEQNLKELSEFMAYDLMSLTGEDSDCLGERGMALVTNEAVMCPRKLT